MKLLLLCLFLPLASCATYQASVGARELALSKDSGGVALKYRVEYR